MNRNEENSVLLAKWLSGELSEEQLSKMDAEELARLEKIKNTVDTWTLPDVQPYATVKEQIQNPAKVVKFYPQRKLLALAASIALLIGLFLFLKPDPKESFITTNQSKEFTLPDGSLVAVNKHSVIRFSKKEWQEGKRKLELEGEAYFKVKEGNTFSVQGSRATVQVLGTAFNVISTPSCQNVACYEGTVSVNTPLISKVITKGQAVAVDEKGDVEIYDTSILSEQRWKNEYIHFSNSSLLEVIAVLETTYGITIELKEENSNRKFTGKVTQSNLKEALASVFLPLAISYELKGEKVILKN